MGGQGDQAPFYSCETLSIEMAFESQNYSRTRARAMTGKLGFFLPHLGNRRIQSVRRVKIEV